MAQYFPQQPPELHSTQSSVITDVKEEWKAQRFIYLVWLWPPNRNVVGRRAYVCNAWQKTQLWFCRITFDFYYGKKRRERGQTPGEMVWNPQPPTSWRTLLIFLRMCVSTDSSFSTWSIFFAAHQPIWYMPTAARTTDESHRHSAKQLVRQRSNSHVNKRDSSWVFKALAREEHRDSLTLLHWICMRSPFWEADV